MENREWKMGFKKVTLRQILENSTNPKKNHSFNTPFSFSIFLYPVAFYGKK